MRHSATLIVGLALAIAVSAAAAAAQPVQLPVPPQPLPAAPAAPTLYLGPPVRHPTGGTFPWVAGLKPYTPETNNMSLEGYLRQLVFWQTGKWISPADAVRVIQQQRAQ